MNLSIIIARALVERVESAGIDRKDFLSETGFDASRLNDVDGRLNIAEYDALVEAALDMTGDAALGLHLGESAVASTYNLPAHLIAHARSLREGLDTLLRFHPLLQDRPVLRIVENGPTVMLVHDGLPGSERCRRFRAEAALAGFLKTVRYFARGARAHSASFEHRAPDHHPEYTRIFAATELFEQPFCGLVIDRSLLAKGQLNTDPEFSAVLEAQAEKRVARLRGKVTYADKLHDHVMTAPARRDMDAAARALGLSPRTLRRRLHEEGVLYDEVVRDALIALSKRLLVDERRSIQEVAYAMSFSDASAFGRAFKRWTGSTPHRYRRLNGCEPDGSEASAPSSSERN